MTANIAANPAARGLGPQKPRFSAAPAPRAGCGFSLLELIVVLMIVAVALAVAAPSLRGFAEGRRSADAARSIIALAGWARSQAVSEGRLYRLHVDSEHGRYWVTAETGGAFDRVDASLGRTFELPDHVGVWWEDPPDVQRLGYVTFYPTGRLTPATLLIQQPSGEQVRVGALAVSDRFAVLDVGETQGAIRP